MAETMTACDRCGAAVPITAGVCPNCGAPLGGVDSSVVGVPPVSVGGTSTQPETYTSDIFSAGAAPGEQAPISGSSAGWSAGRPSVDDSSSDPGSAVAASSGRPQVFDAPPAAASRSGLWGRRLPWVIGCCLGALLLACLLVALFGTAALDIFSR